MATRAHRLLMGAAVLVAVVGVAEVVADDGDLACEQIADRLAGIVPAAEGPPQRWEDLLALSEHQAEAMRLSAEHRRLGCRPVLPRSPTTTVAPPADPRLPRADELGSGFELRPSRGPIGGPGGTASCTFEVPSEPRPTDRTAAWFASQPALQEVAVEVVDYAGAAAARSAFDAVMARSHCRAEGNEQEGGPVEVEVDGAERAFTIGLTDPGGSRGLAVALAGRSLVVVWVDVHFGVATTDLVPSVDVLALVLDRMGRA